MAEMVRLHRGVRTLLVVLAALALIGLWVSQVSRPGNVEGCPVGCARPGDGRPSPEVRIASLNLLHDFPRFGYIHERLELVAREIEALDADIVLLQEAAWTPKTGLVARRLAERLGMNYVYARANGNRWAILFEEGEAVLSRYPLENAGVQLLEPRPAPFEQRIALYAAVRTPIGPLTVVSVHLTTQEHPEANAGQIAFLAQWVRGLPPQPVVVAGDFNAAPDMPQMRLLDPEWLDTWRAAHPDMEGFTCCVDSLTAGPQEPMEKRIDYVFLAGAGAEELRVVEARRAFDRPQPAGGGWLWPSDHVGVFVVLAPR